MVEEVEAILVAAVAAEPNLELDWREAAPDAARTVGSRLEVAARPFPPDAGASRLEAVHVVLVCGGGLAEVLPYLTVGIPVVAFRTELSELSSSREPCVVRAETPGAAGEALG